MSVIEDSTAFELTPELTEKFFGKDLMFLIAVKRNGECVRFYPNGDDQLSILGDQEISDEESESLLDISIRLPKENKQITGNLAPVFFAAPIKKAARAFCRCKVDGEITSC